MRHIALLSVLCISVSATALAAPQQDLKARLAAARMEAQGDNTGTLVLPPETGPVKAEPKKVTAPAIAAQQPLPHPVTDLDLMPKPGATIPLASSNNNAAPVITPVTPPVAHSMQ